jgi:hypothetical protein
MYAISTTVLAANQGAWSKDPANDVNKSQSCCEKKCPKKHVATTMTRRLREIFLMMCQKQAFSFNKREVKVYHCYAFLHVLKRCIKHEKTIKKIFSCMPAASLAAHACRPGTLKCPG